VQKGQDMYVANPGPASARRAIYLCVYVACVLRVVVDVSQRRADPELCSSCTVPRERRFSIAQPHTLSLPPSRDWQLAGAELTGARSPTGIDGRLPDAVHTGGTRAEPVRATSRWLFLAYAYAPLRRRRRRRRRRRWWWWTAAAMGLRIDADLPLST